MLFDLGRITLAVLALSIMLSGCGRRHYRLHTDDNAIALIDQHSVGTPWQLPRSYSVYPSPDSRLADPTDPDFPMLPSPGPFLYSAQTSPTARPEESLPGDSAEPLPVPAAAQQNRASQRIDLQRLPQVITSVSARPREIALASYQAGGPASEGVGSLDPLSAPNAGQPYGEGTEVLTIQPLPATAWQSLPTSSLRHMLEFESVRAEYEKSFPSEDDEKQITPKERYTLKQLVDLAVNNSREYQTQEESLYVAALAVSLQRYDYQLKFTPNGNGFDVNYDHEAINGSTTLNRLATPSFLSLEKTFARGGTFITQFANDVVLDFNGSQGVTSRIGSDVLFGFTQSVLQRDILLDPVIQAERDLIYEARDFARFRKTFFFDVASDYYDILAIYRSVEIDSQNYFSLVRTVEQSKAEVRAGVTNAPNQVTVDQFEQDMLSRRSDVISRTNTLDGALDRLKIRLGLPTDMPLDINLSELEQLTLFDEIEVAVERVTRWQDRVEEQRARDPVERADLVNAGIFMIERIIEWAKLQKDYDGESVNLSEINQLYYQLQLEQAHNELEQSQLEYDQVSGEVVAEPTILVYLRASTLLDSQLVLVDRQLRILGQDSADAELVESGQRLWEQARLTLRDSRAELARNPTTEELTVLLNSLRPYLADLKMLIAELDERLDYDPAANNEVRNARALSDTGRLIEAADALLNASGAGLPTIDIDVDDAMLTGLIQRLDLMNERGFLADDWRRIKFAADDLRSVLNLSAEHRLRNVNEESTFNPLEFDFDSTNTNLRLSLDLPLNRRAQRNVYRRSLFGYQQGRRNLMAFEDGIKLDIRDRLRSSNLIREQYPIFVIQAALAAEQVISIQLQLALGTPNVRGRDLLDALQASRDALTLVAAHRIQDLVNRAQLVLDLELMQLDENGFWPEINDPDYQPEPDLNYPITAGPVYGEIPSFVKPSKLMYHLYCHPRPGDQIERISPPVQPVAESQPTATH